MFLRHTLALRSRTHSTAVLLNAACTSTWLPPSIRSIPSRTLSSLPAGDVPPSDLLFSSPPDGAKFKLSSKFIDRFRDVPPPFGFNGLGEFVYQNAYSRELPDGKKEQWFQTVERVVNGTYNMQKRWIESHELGWNPWQAQHSAQVRLAILPPFPSVPISVLWECAGVCVFAWLG